MGGLGLDALRQEEEEERRPGLLRYP